MLYTEKNNNIILIIYYLEYNTLCIIANCTLCDIGKIYNLQQIIIINNLTSVY